jgi:diaminopimelate epimerase
MEIEFYKYQGTGNDFVMIDNRKDIFQRKYRIDYLCDRRFGIGGDGLILLENDPDANFKMVYYNSDGNQSTMCGNGGRCLVAFAKSCSLLTMTVALMLSDGCITCITEDGIVLQMIDVTDIKKTLIYFLNTGSPIVVSR